MQNATDYYRGTQYVICPFGLALFENNYQNVLSLIGERVSELAARWLWPLFLTRNHNVIITIVRIINVDGSKAWVYGYFVESIQRAIVRSLR